MKKTIIALSAIAVTIATVMTACSGNGAEAAAPPAELSKDSLVKRGSYLVNAMGCDDCHTNKIMGPKGPELDIEHRFGGHLANIPLPKVNPAAVKDFALFTYTQTALVGPWGVSYSANISSDENGIGNWSEAQFIKAIREGKSKGMDNGRPLLPPMPWPMYRNLNDTDLKAIFAFLKTTKPVDNVVPAPKSLAELN